MKQFLSIFKSKIILLLSLTYLFIFVFSSCDIIISSGEIEADDPNIRYTGRFNFENSKNVKFDWPGVYIEAVFEGTSITLLLKDGNNDYNVFIDNQLIKILETTQDSVYEIANDLPDRKHTILISKRTEAAFGVGEFRGFILDHGCKLNRLAGVKKRKFEFIGDSFVAGYGSEGLSPDSPFSRGTENNYISYGPLLARRFNADYMITAISGAGIVRNWGDSTKTSLLPLPEYYDQACVNDTSSKWDFNNWIPDAVFIRLGRNDFWIKPYPSKSTFINGYKKLLKRVRKNFPQAEIFAISGPVRNDPHSFYIYEAVSEFMTEHKDKKIRYVKLKNILKRLEDFGSNWHPNEKGHQKIAKALEPHIKKYMNWK